MIDGPRPEAHRAVEALHSMGIRPVVMLTGHGSVELAVRAMHLGAVEFVTKQGAPHKLVELIDRLTGRPQPVPPAANDERDGGRATRLVDRVLQHLVRR